MASPSSSSHMNATRSSPDNDTMRHSAGDLSAASIPASVNPSLQAANSLDHTAQLDCPPSLESLPWNNPIAMYKPGHYTRRNLLQDCLLMSNDYHRRRVEAVIEYSRDFLRQRGHVQEDEDMMYFFSAKDHVHDAWVEIFLTTPEHYLQMAPTDVQEVFSRQTAQVPDDIQTDGGRYSTVETRPPKRKASEIGNHAQILPADSVDDSIDEQAHESSKRPCSGSASLNGRLQFLGHPLLTDQLLSACSSLDLDRMLDMIISASSAPIAAASHTPTSDAPALSSNTNAVVSVEPVPVAPTGPVIVPAVIPRAVVAPQPALADPIAAFMARNPQRNTVDTSGRGFKGVAMSRGQIRAVIEIEGKALAQLPASANSDARHEMRGMAPPRTVDPTLINCVTTAQEMLTFLPYQTVNYELWDRIRNAWHPKEVADFMAYVRQLQIPTSYHRTAFHHEHDNRPNDVPNRTVTTNIPSNMSPRGRMDKRALLRPLHDYFLYHLGDGVVHYPTGRNAQLMTRCILHVRNVSHDMNVRISEIVQYAARHNITVPAADQIQPDTNVVFEDTPSQAFLDLIDRDFVRRHGRRSGTV